MAGLPRTARIGQLLFVATQAAQELAAERLEPLGLDPRSWGVLATLREGGGLSQIDLARTLSIDRTQMVYLLDKLQARGLVKRAPKQTDRRVNVIQLTPRGESLQQRAAEALASQTERLLEPLSKAEQEQLVSLLGEVVEHWQRSPEPKRTPTGR